MSSHPHTPHQPLTTTNPLSVSVDLPVWTFHVNGITPCVSFCVWLLSLSIVFSGSIHVVAGVGASPLFMAE